MQGISKPGLQLARGAGHAGNTNGKINRASVSSEAAVLPGDCGDIASQETKGWVTRPAGLGTAGLCYVEQPPFQLITHPRSLPVIEVTLQSEPCFLSSAPHSSLPSPEPGRDRLCSSASTGILQRLQPGSNEGKTGGVDLRQLEQTGKLLFLL